MGGQLAWTIRLEDGKEHRMNRWTNSMPALIHSPAFLEGRPQGIDAAIAEWLEMQADWEAHRKDGAYQMPMTRTYAPYPYGLKPSEYGLVLVDFQEKVILSLQGYTNLSRVMLVRQVYGTQASSHSSHKVDELAVLADAGRVAQYRIHLTRKDALGPFIKEGYEIEESAEADLWTVTAPGETDLVRLTHACDAARAILPEHPQRKEIDQLRQAILEETIDEIELPRARMMLDVLENCHAASNSPILDGHAIIDFKPFTLEEFEEDAAGYEALRDRILDLGFELDTDERAAWRDEIASRRQDEALMQEELDHP